MTMKRILNVPGRLRPGLWLAALIFVGSAIQAQARTATDVFDPDAHLGKVVIVDFWASWCVPCRRSFPWMNEMQDKYADQGLVIIAVNLDQEEGAAAGFLADYPAEFEIRYDKEALLAKELEVQAMPTSFLFGRDGRVQSKHMGFKVKKQAEYEAAIVAALQMQESSAVNQEP